ncbi:GNAT family N-acetyltransferase [Flexibacterium corallicola]|uniref:GNAT family N-acetyltransferase n=1 Tax=Flexibacterium corallicola TaxID=3037259 RepID=UPI00286F2D2B|nr:GNAT family N-acetyltransferase [Pseudovibrio sp. M1P-2-3]
MSQADITDAYNIDPSELAELRAQVMRPSLEAVGRFNEVRVRERFLSGFDPADTRLILINKRLLGFYVVRDYSDHLYLDHLYIKVEHQGEGLGRMVVRSIQEEAKKAGLPLRLKALKDSPANRFYQSCGFEFQSCEGVDNHYIWQTDSKIEG